MKKMITAFLAFCLLLSLFGCGAESNPDEEAILFYYPRVTGEYEYGASDGVISFEERDPAGHRNNLRYLLTLYLLGPVDESLVSPFPDGCQILDLKREEMEVTITFNSSLLTLKDMDLTLACVSLARTCFGLTDAQILRIISESTDGQTTIDETITRQQLLMEDTPLPTESTK